MEKFKKVSKYVLNGLNMVNALLIALAPIWGFNADKIINTIIAITAVLSAYLVGGKLFSTEEIETQNVEMPEYPEEDIELED